TTARSAAVSGSTAASSTSSSNGTPPPPRAAPVTTTMTTTATSVISGVRSASGKASSRRCSSSVTEETTTVAPMATPPEPKSPVRPDQRDDNAGDRPPWRVENPRPPKSRLGRMTDQRGRPRPSFWTLLALLLLVNWIGSAIMLREEARADIPYTVFRAQVEAGNVSEITAIDDSIEGNFKNQVKYPPGEKGRDVRRFSTHRPTFAEDNVFQLLADKGVEVNAKSPPGPSFFERLLIGFGPTLLFIGL